MMRVWDQLCVIYAASRTRPVAVPCSQMDGRERGGGGEAGEWIDHWVECMSAVTRHWHNHALFCSSELPVRGVISWDGPIHTEPQRFTTVKRVEPFENVFYLVGRLAATHTVIAVLTQVIGSDEKGHQLPVILKIHRLKGSKRGQNEDNIVIYL